MQNIVEITELESLKRAPTTIETSRSQIMAHAFNIIYISIFATMIP